MSTTPKTTVYGKTPVKQQPIFLFDKENYMWMIGGVALIFIGFMLMSGGKSPDPHAFNYDEIYSFRRITLAPIVVLLGFAVEVYAIMKKPKETNMALTTIPDTDKTISTTH
jgi:hypothetical protein